MLAKGVGQLLTVGFLIPQFWLAILLVVIFAVELHWLPASGYDSFPSDPKQHIEHLIIPVLALAIPTTALYYRYLRQSLQEVLQTQYIRTARAKGLTESRVLYRHALPNALIPSLSVLGIQFGQLLGGVVVIELILNWPGIGGLLMYSVQREDNNTLIAVVMAIAVAYVVVSTLSRSPTGSSTRGSGGRSELAARHNRKLQIGLLILLPFLLAAIMPGVLAPHSPDALLGTPFSHPSSGYLLGTDEDGRDILSRLIFAARSDLAISLSATLIAR